ncbi:MAG: MBL fold metallo-hydrolase [Blastocatellia bacterium]|nr:MBL fold metallo-hydrolase [Blastocatellia bacterium]
MGLYLKQLLAGRDFAKNDAFASGMANFVYVLGDNERKECMVVDPAWDVPGIIDFIESEEMNLVGALVTHYHPDHVGGDLFGYKISGLSQLLSLKPVRIHVSRLESEGVKLVTGVSAGDLEEHEGGDEVEIGNIRAKLLHTPGHTPGSQCFLADGNLVSGDTLFIGGCGRVDLPGGSAEDLYNSLTQVLGRLPDETMLYPGHDYASMPVSTIGAEKKGNYCFRVSGLEGWMSLMGRQ